MPVCPANGRGIAGEPIHAFGVGGIEFVIEEPGVRRAFGFSLGGRLIGQRGMTLQPALIVAAGDELGPGFDKIGVGRAHLSRPVVGAGLRTVRIGTIAREVRR